MRVGVVGGGAVGVTAARELAARGADVVLFERETVGSGATGRAAGVVHDAFAEGVEADLADEALARFRDLSGEGGFRLHETPYVWFATEEGATADAVRESAERMRDVGRDVATLEADALRRRFPQLRTDDVVAAAVAEDGAVADPAAYADRVATLAREAGVEVREGTTATLRADPPRVDAGGTTERFDAVAVAAGAHTKRVVADAGLALATKPYRVQAMRCPGPAVPTAYDATAGYYFRPHARGILAGDGTERVESDPDDWDREADDGFAASLLDRLRERVVNLESDVETAWAGLCTATPDRYPLLGELADGVFVATGWHGHGFMLAPATGRLLADQALGGDGVSRFDPARFRGDEEFEVVEGMTLD